MCNTVRVYVVADGLDEARGIISNLFHVKLYSPYSTEDGEESKPDVRPADVYYCDLEDDGGIAEAAARALAMEQILAVEQQGETP